MSVHVHHELYYHLVWSTKGREPFLHEGLEEQVYHFIENKCKHLGYGLLAINGMPDHVHLAIELPPAVSVSEAAKNIKGSSSYFVNQELVVEDWLYWQEGYGAFTVSKRNLKALLRYIKNQKRHHTEDSIISEYEDSAHE